MTTEKKRKARRQLPSGKWPAFLDEFRRFWPTIVERQLSYVDAAKAIGIAIGFPDLAVSTIKDLAIAEGKEWPRRKVQRATGENKRDRTRALAGIVAQLFDKLGEPRPDALTLIMSGRFNGPADDGTVGPLFDQPPA